MLKKGDTVYFGSEQGIKQGVVNTVNKKTVSITTEEKEKKEGYQTWRVTEYFISSDYEEAKEKWENYKQRLKEFKLLLKQRRQLHEFQIGFLVLVNSLNNKPYEATILKVNSISLDVVTKDRKFMKVDKALCEPLGISTDFALGSLF